MPTLPPLPRSPSRSGTRGRALRELACWLLCFVELGCSPELAGGRPRGGTRVESLDGRPLDACSPAPRLVVRPRSIAQGASLFAGLRLFEGELSSYAERQLRDGEMTAALAKREIPLSVWFEEGALIAQPARFLDPDATYTLTTLGSGTLAVLRVALEPWLPLHRVWPPAVAAGGSVLYCADSPWAGLGAWLSALSSALAPSDEKAVLSPGVGLAGVDGARCVTMETPEELAADFLLPPFGPSSAADLEGDDTNPVPLFDPTPVGVAHRSREDLRESVDCVTPLGPACASFVGPELVLEGARGAWAVRAEGPEGARIEGLAVSAETTRVGFFGFRAGTTYELSGTHFDAWGFATHGALSMQTGAPAARLVLNEVLANPLGAEPASEWIEIVNVGSSATSLAGYFVEDGGGRIALPDVVLQAGSFGLIVGRDYRAGGEDIVPDAAAVPIVVERVGVAGLGNAGERVALVSADGETVSMIPALPAKRPGVSWARKSPWAPDVADSFGMHAAPGASPGADNVLGN